jgi:hypothetical protein
MIFCESPSLVKPTEGVRACSVDVQHEEKKKKIAGDISTVAGVQISPAHFSIFFPVTNRFLGVTCIWGRPSDASASYSKPASLVELSLSRPEQLLRCTRRL